MPDDGEQVPDLGALKSVPPTLAARARANAEMQLGLRCYGCGRRIEEGIHAHAITLTPTLSGVKAEHRRVSACARPDCDFALDAMADATYVENVQFAWLEDDPGVPDGR